MSNQTRLVKFNKRSGFSIVEVVVALAILGVTAAAVTTLMVQNQKVVVKAETASVFDASLQKALELADSVVSDAGPSQDRGLCRLMTTGAKMGGIGFIEAKLPAAQPFAAERPVKFDDWALKFAPASWTPVTSGCSDGGNYWQRCYRPKDGTVGISKTLNDAQQPEFRFLITPVKLRSTLNATQGYTPVNLPSAATPALDARDIGFVVTARVLYRDGTDQTATRVSRERHSLVWMGAANCRKVVSANKTLILSASGIGSGNASADQLYSATQKSADTALAGVFRDTVYIRGELLKDSDGNVINSFQVKSPTATWITSNGPRARTLTDPASTARSGCVETSYRCRNRSEPRSWASRIESNLAIKFNPNNSITKGDGSSLRATVEIALEGRKDLTTLDRKPLGNTEFMVSPPNSFLGSAPVTYAAGSAIELKGSSPNNVCSNVCSKDRNYNSDFAANGTAQDTYGLSYTFQLPDYSNSEVRIPSSASDRPKLGCVCCFTKQCAAIGTQTKGWCYEQPPEPLDSRIPECAAGTQSTEITTRLPLTAPSVTAGKLVKYEFQGLEASKCLSVQTVQVGGSLQLRVEPKPCDNSLPILCYAQGRFVASPTGSFSQAPQVCYDLGQETFQAAELEQMIENQFGPRGPSKQTQFELSMLPPKAANGSITFVNASLSGIFLAPQDQEQLTAVTAYGDLLNKPHWIALRTDEQKEVVAALPEVAPSPSQNVSFFDYQGDIHFLKDRGGIFVSNPLDTLSVQLAGPSDEAGVVLHHSRKVFGAAAVKIAQAATMRPLQALCWDPTTGEFSRSTGSTHTPSHGAALCRADNKFFYPPLQPLQWAAAMLLAKPNHELLPFPLFGENESLQDASLWVALRRAPSGGPADWTNFPARAPAFWSTGYGPPSGQLMDAWGFPLTSGDPDYFLCHASGVSATPFELRPSSQNACEIQDGPGYWHPSNELEEARFFDELIAKQALRSGVVIRVAPTPAPTPSPSASASASAEAGPDPTESSSNDP